MYEYRLLDSGEAEIIAYNGNETDVVIPETLEGHSVGSIGENAFRSYFTTSVIIPEGVKAIGNFAFSWCENLTSVTIPDSVALLGYNPFAGNPNLTEIRVGQDNPVLEFREGVLFHKQDKSLIWCPAVCLDS